jgi:hypothetical protein
MVQLSSRIYSSGFPGSPSSPSADDWHDGYEDDDDDVGHYDMDCEELAGWQTCWRLLSTFKNRQTNLYIPFFLDRVEVILRYRVMCSRYGFSVDPLVGRDPLIKIYKGTRA